MPSTDAGSASNALAPLVRFDAVSSLSENIGEGGFDYRIRGGTFYAPHLVDCARQEVDDGVLWAKQHGLPILLETVEPGRGVLHVAAPGQSGFLELLYRSTPGQSASVSLMVFDNDGNRFAAELSKLDGLDLPAFTDKLKESLQCAP